MRDRIAQTLSARFCRQTETGTAAGRIWVSFAQADWSGSPGPCNLACSPRPNHKLSGGGLVNSPLQGLVLAQLVRDALLAAARPSSRILQFRSGRPAFAPRRSKYLLRPPGYTGLFAEPPANLGRKAGLPSTYPALSRISGTSRQPFLCRSRGPLTFS